MALCQRQDACHEQRGSDVGGFPEEPKCGSFVPLDKLLHAVDKIFLRLWGDETCKEAKFQAIGGGNDGFMACRTTGLAVTGILSPVQTCAWNAQSFSNATRPDRHFCAAGTQRERRPGFAQVERYTREKLFAAEETKVHGDLVSLVGEWIGLAARRG